MAKSVENYPVGKDLIILFPGRKDVYLMFKALNTDKTGKLSLEEFYNIYDVCDLDWKVGGGLIRI